MATKTTARKRNTKSATKAAPKTNSKPAGFDWPRAPKAILLDYLKSEVTDAQDAPNRAKPFINENGIVHLHSTDWRRWLTEQGLNPTKAEAAKPLRDAGLSVKAFPLPGEGRALGFYIGKAPAGTKSLPVRKAVRRPRASRPFARFTDEQREVIGRGLQAYEFDADDAALAQVRDDLLAKLDQ